MRLNSFTVDGYKNLTEPVTFGPLSEINVLHGPNNVGKSNLIAAIDLFFGLLGVGSQVSKEQFTPMDANEAIPGHPFTEIFHAANPSPIHLQAELSLPRQELEASNITPECPTDPCTITLELTPVANGAQLRVTQFQMGTVDVAKDGSGPVGFAESLRAFIAGTFFMQTEQTLRPFALLDPYRLDPGEGVVRGLVSDRVRDALFDARQSLDRERRARWALFVRLMRELEPELGPGEFDTAFDRCIGRANLVYDTGESSISIDRLGTGVQRMVALLGSLVLVRASLVGFAEPELGLTPSAQQRLLRAARGLLAAPGGPAQLFFTTHSPVLGGGDSAFAMSLQDGVPMVEQRPCEGALEPLPELSPRLSSERVPADLDTLIGLVDQLSEIEPEELVTAAPAASLRARAPEASPPAEAPSEAPPGTPPWKWQPKK